MPFDNRRGWFRIAANAVSVLLVNVLESVFQKRKETYPMKRILALLLAATFLLAACQPAATPTAEPTKAAPPTTAPQPTAPPATAAPQGLPDLGGREIRIAVENAYNPFNFIDPATGEAVGYDYDLFNEACQRLNCKPTFVQTAWDAIVAVMGGQGQAEFDIAADGITITEERAQKVDFS
ncbi:MAG TPA: transporter substrate-binding domain-containing protein, partial [Anaerolineales bacterium]|nr:transporter substrate-binding domain-containing protein [Anaerolineales bacterium]